MVYRAPGDASEPIDPEAAAIAELSRRAGRVRALIHVPVLLVGILAGVLLYTVLRDLQFARNGAHIPWLTGVASFVPTFGGSFWLAPRLSTVVVRPALARWRAELAKKHGLDLVELQEMTRLLE
jgi:hypothetical protein